ncbi:MAG: hypothetical protein RLZZ201_1394, partial [Actinomycetota bacterium]
MTAVNADPSGGIAIPSLRERRNAAL